ncbi:MAG: MBL fold metallo-hydrolase [Candidatus Dormibacteria bacterium]
MQIETIETPELGDRSYLVHDGARAIVIDPQRDFDRVIAVAERAGVHIDLVLETHIHNDYVSGGLALARAVGARYGVAAAEPVDFERAPIAPGESLQVGRLTVRAEEAPGHTLHHLAFVIDAEGGSRAVFSGGSLLYGTVGRTDLDYRRTPAELTRAQYRGVRRLPDILPTDVSIHPTHGFGSFCSSAASSGATSSTIGREREGNLVSTCPDEDSFVSTILDGLTAYPRYYAQMGPANRRGALDPALATSAPQPLGREELRARLQAGEWVVDLQGRRPYAARHLRGTVSMELSTNLTTYLGWVLPPNAPLTLLGSVDEISAAQRALVRIGLDRPAAALRGAADDLMEMAPQTYRVVDFKAVATETNPRSDTVLDVRRHDEWRAGHIRDALHIPLPELLERLGEVPTGRLWVHCAGGFRASIAASLLSRSGYDVVLIDDEFTNVPQSGLLLEEPAGRDIARRSAGDDRNQEGRDGKPGAEPAHAAGHR